jgi:hypothetical protein
LASAKPAGVGGAGENDMIVIAGNLVSLEGGDVARAPDRLGLPGFRQGSSYHDD